MSQPVLAYIDPGTGSMLLQIILGGLAAAAVFLKMFWRRLLILLRIRRPEPEPGAEAAGAEAHAREGEAVETRREPAARR